MYKNIFITVFLAFATALFGAEQTIYSPNDSYTVVEKIGEGAFGNVFAVENSQGVKYALKSYKPVTIEDPFFILLSNPKREYEKGQLLNHPNIVQSIEYFETPDTDEFTEHLVLEFVEGTTMGRTAMKSLTLQEIINIELELIDALKYSLSQNLIYMDLHSGNIILNKERKPTIIDLASFISFKELIELAKAYPWAEPTAEEKEEITENDDSFPIQKKRKALKRFFAKQEKLLKKLKSPNLEAEDTIKHKVIANYLPFYFDQITEICSQILSKMDISKEEKIELRVEIKKLSWSYLYDVEDDIDVNIHDYLNLLNEFLTQCQQG